MRVFFNGWVDKQNVEYTYNGILFSLKEEGNANTACLNFQDIVPSKINQYEKINIAWFYLSEIPRILKFTETQSRIVVSSGWGDRKSVV